MDYETIKRINETLKTNTVTILSNIDENVFNKDGYDGYSLETSLGFIFVGISNSQDCCEVWGYDYLIENKAKDEDFKGARVLSIEVNDDVDFSPLRIETTKGTIDLWVYNNHNGYYMHSTIIEVFGELVGMDRI